MRANPALVNSAISNATIDISILIVSYNTCDMTLAAIQSALDETTATKIEIIIVDNASTDGSADAISARFPQANNPHVHLIRSERNLGFAAGNNLASAKASGKRLLLLNPDTVVTKAAIDKLNTFANNTETAGIWGGRTVFADGNLNKASCWQRMTVWNQVCRTSGLAAIFPNSSFFNAESFGAWQRDTVRHVDIVSGCFLLIDHTLWRTLGGFAPIFFMYGEEADLCLRAKAHGARPVITPDAEIIHHGGASEKVRADKMVRLLAAKSELIERHMSGLSRPIARTALHAWPHTRLIATKLAARLFDTAKWHTQVETWRTVLAHKPKWRHGFSRLHIQPSHTGALKSNLAPAKI